MAKENTVSQEVEESAAVENTAETAPSQREMWQKEIADTYPEGYDFTNEDDYYRASREGYQKRNASLKDITEKQRAFSEHILSNPELSEMIVRSTKEGSLPENFYKYILEQDGWEQALENSESEVAAFKQQHEMSDEEFEKFFESTSGELAKALRGFKINHKLLNYLKDSYYHEKDVSEAKKEGYIKGKNEAIEAKRSLGNAGSGSGISSAGGATGKRTAPDVYEPKLRGFRF